jgi:hypothetical protein
MAQGHTIQYIKTNVCFVLFCLLLRQDLGNRGGGGGGGGVGNNVGNPSVRGGDNNQVSLDSDGWIGSY